MPLKPHLLSVAGGLLLLAPSAQASYIFQNIINMGDVNFNQELAINNAGAIAGYFGDSVIVPNNGYTVAPPYGNANFTAENFPGIPPNLTETQTQVTGINNLGNTVGFWVDQNGINYGFTDFGGVLTSVGPSPNAPVFTQFLGLNDHDEVAGFSMNALGTTSALLYMGGVFTNITPFAASNATATGVNNSGTAVGFYTDAGTGDTLGFIHGVNHGFEFPGSTFTQFLGINNSDLIVGVYQDSAGNNHGFTFNELTSQWQTVDDPFAVPGAGNGTTINGLNDKGQLVGFYVNAAGQTIGLLANPASTPEPASFLLLGVGGALLAWRKRALLRG